MLPVDELLLARGAPPAAAHPAAGDGFEFGQHGGQGGLVSHGRGAFGRESRRRGTHGGL